MEYKTGTLVEFRSRPWVVQQSSDKDILIIKPLGGTDAEVIGLYKPLYKDQLNSMVCSYNFRKPSSDDVGANRVILRQHVFFIMRADYHFVT